MMEISTRGSFTMLRDRHKPMDLFALVPKLGLEMDPILTQLDDLLDDDLVFHKVKVDLARRYPQTLTRGRLSTPVEVILRMLVIKRLYRWSYEQTEHFISDSLVLRQFCRVYLESVPDDSTLIRWANQVGPKTMERINDRVVELARSLKVTRGRKLRTDSTVVETNIHHPTDSRILGDGVRVLSRLLRRAKKVVGSGAELGQEAFRSRTRSVRRLAQQIHRVARHRGQEATESLKRAYAKLIQIAEASQGQAEQVRDALQGRSEEAARRLATQFEHFLPLVGQVISQATRRVIDGEVVPSKEKLLSLFEPHTQVIVRHKAGKPTEFGRKLLLDEVDGGIISRYEVLKDGGGQDHPYLRASLQGHQKRFGKPPKLLAGDRGVYTPDNEKLAKEFGVKYVVLPKVGRISSERREHERQSWFRRGFKFRAGIEGRISVLKRCQGLDVCLNHGEEGFGRWVGWGVVTANLVRIARAQLARQAN
jgi:transposase, IS5 family